MEADRKEKREDEKVFSTLSIDHLGIFCFTEGCSL